jgi:hypothetical protein
MSTRFSRAFAALTLAALAFAALPAAAQRAPAGGGAGYDRPSAGLPTPTRGPGYTPPSAGLPSPAGPRPNPTGPIVPPGGGWGRPNAGQHHPHRHHGRRWRLGAPVIVVAAEPACAGLYRRWRATGARIWLARYRACVADVL